MTKREEFIASLDTTVAVSRTVSQVQALVERFKAREFRTIYGQAGEIAAVRFTIVDPSLSADESETASVFTVELYAPSQAIERVLLGRRGRTDRASRERIAAQAQRVAWRQLHDVICSSLIAVQSGLFTIGEAFLCNLIVTRPDGKEQRLGEMMIERRLLTPSGGKLLLGAGK